LKRGRGLKKNQKGRPKKRDESGIDHIEEGRGVRRRLK